MPVYQYACSACGKEFEVSQKMSDPPVSECACGSKGTVQRLLSTGAGFILKGSGFYQTDYKGAARKAAESSEKSAGSEKPATAEKKEAPAVAPAANSGCGSGCGCHS